MTKREAQERQSVRDRLAKLGITYEESETLRKASMTLHRWAEGECGADWGESAVAIERDETTGKPFRVYYPRNGKSYRIPIRDLERGALQRIDEVCAPKGVNWYHQTDPRGCALYVAKEPLTDSDYNRGIAVY